MLEVNFVFAEKVIPGHRKLFTNLFGLPQRSNLETRANKKDNIPFWHFRNEKCLQKEMGFSVTQMVFVLSSRIPKDEKNSYP